MEVSVADNIPIANVRPRRWLRTFFLVTFAGGFLVLFDALTGQFGLFSHFSPAGPTLKVTSSICGTWELKPEPFSGLGTEMQVNGIAASPSGKVWAVGDATSLLGDGYHPALTQWEGNHWRMIGLPDLHKEKAYLSSAYFLDDEEGWAVGQATVVGPDIIVMHWNGWNWSLSPTPDKLGGLSRVRGSSRDDVWAVGWQNLAQPMQEFPLLMHWDGNAWKEVKLPDALANTHAELYDVLPIAKDNLWVVGQYNWSGPKEPLIWQWDGTNWNSVSAPTKCSGQHTLTALSAVSADDIWAVGSCNDGNQTLQQMLVQHWDGTRWNLAGDPRTFANYMEGSGSLSAVVALSSSDVWAAGTRVYNGVAAFVQHWDGSTWQSVEGPPAPLSPQTGQDFISISPREFWLMGYAYSGYNPVVARFVLCP